jgi:glycosyltransferase involved in cell wall biosynthesis
MPTVVSVTPLRVEADSRTFKQAASIRRFGHRSIVVEGQRSRMLATTPFELQSLRSGADRMGARTSVEGPDAPSPPQGRDGRADIRGMLRRALAVGRRWVKRRLPWLPRQLTVPLWVLSYARAQRAMLRALPTADLYVVHSPFFFPAVWLATRRHDASFIYDAHDMYSVLWRDGRMFSWQDRLVLRISDLIERACVRGSAARVTVSNGLAGAVERRFGRGFAVVRNAHDARLDVDPPTTLREELGLQPRDLLLVVIGNVKATGMALEEALRAVLLLPPHVHLAFVGAGYDAWKIKAQDLDVAERAHFMPPVQPTEVARYVAGADLAPILYVPITVQFRNALPNGFFHAIAAGLPVLYSTALLEVAQTAERLGIGRPFDPSDPASMAAVVRALDADRDALAHLRARTVQARSKLSWEHEERTFARVLNEALES